MRLPAGPESDCAKRTTSAVARIPMRHPATSRMLSFLVSRENHLPFLFPINRFNVSVFFMLCYIKEREIRLGFIR
jgi:hypothetical protein